MCESVVACVLHVRDRGITDVYAYIYGREPRWALCSGGTVVSLTISASPSPCPYTAMCMMCRFCLCRARRRRAHERRMQLRLITRN